MAVAYVTNSWTSTASSTASESTWAHWNATYTTAATTTNEAVWAHWNTGWAATTNAATNVTYLPGAAPPLSEAEQARAREREQARAAAQARAEELLLLHLTPEQRRAYTEEGAFVVVSDQGRRFRVHCRRGISGNVELLGEDGRAARRLCAHPDGSLPHPDVFLAQKLALETDEAAFVQVANVHHLAA